MESKKPVQRFNETSINERQRVLFGERYVGVTLSQIRAPEWAQLKIMAWMAKPKNFLIYLGNPGIGKTFLCAALVPWAMETFENFRYHNERNLFTRIRESIDQTKGDYLETLKYLIDDELVMIDDIGSSGFTDWRKDIFFEAIDVRYNSLRPTVITSNLSKEDFRKSYHPRLYSRLFAAENTVILLDTLQDFRQD